MYICIYIERERKIYIYIYIYIYRHLTFRMSVLRTSRKDSSTAPFGASFRYQ